MPPTKFNVTPVRCNKEPLLRASARSGADTSFFVGSRDHRFDVAGGRRSTTWGAGSPKSDEASGNERTGARECRTKATSRFSHSLAD
jgi:hypothetical protein